MKFCNLAIFFENVNGNLAHTCVLKVGLGCKLDDVIGEEKYIYIFRCKNQVLIAFTKCKVELTQTLTCKKTGIKTFRSIDGTKISVRTIKC